MKRMRFFRLILLPLLVLPFVPYGAPTPSSEANALQVSQLKGLLRPARIIRDSNYIPHIYAENDHDAVFLLGYVHARDRFFQMDFLRRQLSGTLAELVGQAALPSDIQLRTLGLRRAAEASVAAYGAGGRALFDAYADGVNAYLQDANTTLPPEYTALELTKAGVPPWTAADSAVIGKGLAFQLSFDATDDIDLTTALAEFQARGQAGGFDGTVLLMEDVYRSQPFDTSISIPGFLPGSTATTNSNRRKMMIEAARNLPKVITPEALKLADQYMETVKQVPFLQGLMDRRSAGIGSNWWLISGSKTTTGYPMLANDPHLSLDTSPVFYEAHMNVSNDPVRGAMNVNGVSFAGTPVIVLGCNDRICWGATTNPMDVTDVYQERLVLNLATQSPTATVFGMTREALVVIPQSYRLNRTGDGTADNIVDSGIKPSDAGGLTFLVPRRNNGPIIAVDARNILNVTGLSVQYTGWGATNELQTFVTWARARNLDEFKRGLESFDFGSQNWAYADVDGNIAYHTSGELPLREDLQSGRIDGTPPFLIRDGTHQFMNEWLPVTTPQPGQAVPFEVLPQDEMPHVVNPAQGYIANCNNDPVGTTSDNNPLNQLRKGGGIYYLNVGYAGGFRQGRITRLIEAALANAGKVTMGDIARFQSNNQMLDAEVLTGHIWEAFENAGTAGAPAALAALGQDPRIIQAVIRFRDWDFSTPTGLREGYDPGDDPSDLPEPTAEGIRNSVAATIYSVWRGQIVRATIDATLTRLGLGNRTPGSDQALSALRRLLDDFATMQGRGSSGVNFFQVDGAPTPEAARDILILQSLQRALDLLASDTFAAAFGNSTNQDDYRWGKLHRIVFDHPLGGVFNIPSAGGFSNLSAGLQGVAKGGGFDVLDASGHSARSATINSFMFGGGPARRFVGEMTPGGADAFQIIPGGQSGVLGSPFYANLLGRWLTGRYHPLLLTSSQVSGDLASEEVFVP